MLCQNCGKNEANVRYTQIINGVKKQMTLCSDCAEELGIESMDFNMPINFSSFLTDMFDDYNDYIPKLINSNDLVCENCNMSYDEFLNKGRFGCEKCYENFETKINKLLKNIQGTDMHNGRLEKKLIELDEKQNKKENKRKSNKEEKVENEEKNTEKENEKFFKIEKLKQKLKIEVEEERYEDAAKTRDEIKKLEE